MDNIDRSIDEIEFYQQKLKEVKARLFSEIRKRELLSVKVIDQEITDKYAIYHGDCVEILKGIPDNSIHYMIFSPPFSNLFCYSASLRDMGNSTEDQFYDHFWFVVPEMYRVMMPGRLLSFHCSDIPAMKERDGYIGLKDFPSFVRAVFENVGFIYHSKVLIWKDPLLEVVRTKTLGLAHKQVVKDSTRCRQGTPDYVITMLKPGINPELVSRGRGFETYIGEKEEPKVAKNDDPSTNKYSHYVWQRYASPVWMDIRQTNTLNVRAAREDRDERHICPLQLDVIARCLELWTNKGDTVLSPFAGIGSEGYEALRMERKFIGIELKDNYYYEMRKNLKMVVSAKRGFVEMQDLGETRVKRMRGK